MKTKLLPLIFCILISCSDNLLNNPLDYFPKSISLKASKVVDLEKFNILQPCEVVLFKDWLVFSDGYNKNGVIKCISNDFSKLISGVYLGSGPYDVSDVVRIEVNSDSIYIKDCNLRKLLSAEISDSSIILNVSSYNCNLDFYCRLLNNKKFVLVDQFNVNFSFLSIVDNNNKIYSKLNYPIDKNISKLDSISLWKMYWNTCLALSPAKDKFAWGVNYFPSYGFGEIKNDTLVLLKEFEYFPADIEILSSNEPIMKDKSIKNVCSSIGTEKFVIFVYQGFYYNNLNLNGNTLLLYSWQGNPIMKIDINYGLYYINYDKRRNILFGLGKGDNEENFYIEYDMNGIID